MARITRTLVTSLRLVRQMYGVDRFPGNTFLIWDVSKLGYTCQHLGWLPIERQRRCLPEFFIKQKLKKIVKIIHKTDNNIFPSFRGKNNEDASYISEVGETNLWC